MKKPKQAPKSNSDSNDDFPSDELSPPKKNEVNGGKTSKKMFVTLTVMIAWLVALTVVLLIFILENSKGNLEERVRLIEAKTASPKVGGKIIIPDSNVISDLQNRVSNIENKLTTGPVTGSAPTSPIDNQIIAGINDRLKRVEEKIMTMGPVAKGDVGTKSIQDKSYIELKERLDRLETLVTKVPVSVQTTPKASTPSQPSATPDRIITAKSDIKKTRSLDAVPKKKPLPKKKKVPSTDAEDYTAYDKSSRGDKSRGFLTPQTGGYRPVSSGAGVIHQLGNHYDSMYNQHLEDLRGFSSSPTYDEALQAGKIIYIPTGKR